MKINTTFTTRRSEALDITNLYTNVEEYMAKKLAIVSGYYNNFKEVIIGGGERTARIENELRKAKRTRKSTSTLINTINVPSYFSGTLQAREFLDTENKENFYPSMMMEQQNKLDVNANNTLLVDKENDMYVTFTETSVEYEISSMIVVESKHKVHDLKNTIYMNYGVRPGIPTGFNENVANYSVRQALTQNVNDKLLNTVFEDYDLFYNVYFPMELEDKIFRDFIIERPMIDIKELETSEGKKRIVEEYMNSYSGGSIIYEFDATTNKGRLGFKYPLHGSYTYELGEKNVESENGIDPILSSVIVKYKVNVIIPSIILYSKNYNNLTKTIFTDKEYKMIVKRSELLESNEINDSQLFTEKYNIKKNMNYLNDYLDFKITRTNLDDINEDMVRQKTIIVAAFRKLKSLANTDPENKMNTMFTTMNPFTILMKKEYSFMQKTNENSYSFGFIFSGAPRSNIEKDGKNLTLSSYVEFDTEMATKINIDDEMLLKPYLKDDMPKEGLAYYWYKIPNIFNSDLYKLTNTSLSNGEIVTKVFRRNYTPSKLFENRLYRGFTGSKFIIKPEDWFFDTKTNDIYIVYKYRDNLILTTYLQLY